MSLNHEPTSPGESGQKSSPLKFLMKIAIVHFFMVGTVVSAGSFGLFGCVCTDGFTRRENPTEGIPAPAILRDGEVPQLPPLPK